MLGSEYNFQFSGSRTETNSPLQTLDPEFRSSFSLDFTQPLLRDLIWNEPWTRVKTTRVLYDETLEEFRRQVMDTVQQVEDSYWNLIATDEQKAVAEKSLETARALLDQTTTQYEVGVVSKVEVFEAEAGVADRDVSLIRAQNAYLSAQDQLVNLILGTGLTAESNILVEPTDKPEDYVFTEIDAGSATQRAFEHRPELAIIEDELQRQLFEQKFANNQRLPNLDVRVGYGNRGLAGDTATSSSDFGDSLDDFLTDDAADQFSARAMFSIPIPNTTARSRATQAEIEIRRTHAQKRRLEQSIILEIRKAIRDVKSTHEGIEAARRASAASAEQLRAERIRLEYGESTPFDVLLREEDFVEDESLEINAMRLYRISITALSRAQGSILSNRNIAIDAVRTLR
jgi:outer membrane protein